MVNEKIDKKIILFIFLGEIVFLLISLFYGDWFIFQIVICSKTQSTYSMQNLVSICSILYEFYCVRINTFSKLYTYIDNLINNN